MYNKNFILKKNCNLEECLEIFEDNKQNFVFDRECILNPKFTKYACLLDGEVLGYIVVYENNDFIKQEKFSCDYEINEKCVYIWHIIVHSKATSKGVGKFLIENLKTIYNCPIYVVIEEDNIPSLKLHLSCDFKCVHKFQDDFHGKITNFSLLCWTKK